MINETKLILHKTKFRENISFLKKRSKSKFFCPMVKANAYGVGDIQVVSELLDLNVVSLGVARVEEGIKLRRYFPHRDDMQILVFHPIFEDHLKFYQASKLTPVICSFRELELFIKSSLELKIHLKFDLGMNRFGFKIEDAERLSKTILESNITVEALCGHFPNGEDLKEKESSESFKSLLNLKKIKEEHFSYVDLIHAPNSDAILNGDFEVGLRPGLCMYYSDKKGSPIKNALSLTSPIVEIREINKGEGVSYNSTFKAKERSRIAVLPIGYADGLPRGLSNKISVEYENKSFPLVGAICMDYCMVDIGLDSDLRVGDKLDFLGDNMQNLAQWSKILGTISYEIVTGFGPRIKRGIV